jgi:hypothetical protein
MIATLRAAALGAAASVTLGASTCATTSEPRVVTKEVRVPVPVSCVPKDLKAPPSYPDTDEALTALPDAAARYLLMAAGRGLRMQRASEVEPVITACRDPAP